MLSPLSSVTSTPIHSPGLLALEKAKNIKGLSVFKLPMIPAKRKKVKVLDEETYVEKIGEIIQRDFYPDLEKLKAQNEYLEALEHNDTKKMRELFEKYSFERPNTERLASPATFETPVRKENEIPDATPASITSSQGSIIDQKAQEQKVGLDEFLNSHTSEDNASFEEILVENQKKHQLKYAWLYKPETESKMLAIVNDTNQQLAIENGTYKRPFEIDTWNYKNKNFIMYIPDGVELTSDEKIEMAKNKQEAIYSNTRLKFNPFNEQQNKQAINEVAKVQSKANDGKIGVDGKEIIRTETPRINGYKILATPSPMPDDICDSPIMTWGVIEGTPFRLDGGDTPMLYANQGPSFRMAEPPKREKIAMQLAEKAGERNRDKKMKALNAARRSLATPSPRSTYDRLSTMSPAARRLATQKLRISLSPSPSRCSASKTPLFGIRTPTTPRLNSPFMKSTPSCTITKPQTPVLTDNLLNLPQRQRAADFFNN